MSTMLVVKLSDLVEVSEDQIDDPLCVIMNKLDYGSLVT